MEIESLENSPGNTLKRKIDVTVMSESPAPRRRLESGGARLEDAPPRTNMNPQVREERKSPVVRHLIVIFAGRLHQLHQRPLQAELSGDHTGGPSEVTRGPVPGPEAKKQVRALL